MERDEFIKSLGLGLAMVCAGTCLSSCGKSGNDGPDGKPDPGPGDNTATVDLSTQLKAVGDQAKVNGVLFFRIADGNTAAAFVATESICPHQGGSLVWKQADNKIQCQLHFSEYGTNGSVLQGPQGTTGNTRTLKIYNTAISGTKLTATIA